VATLEGMNKNILDCGLIIVTPISLADGYQRFGEVFFLQLQDTTYTLLNFYSEYYEPRGPNPLHELYGALSFIGVAVRRV
jgi:hypothetical protein